MEFASHIKYILAIHFIKCLTIVCNGRMEENGMQEVLQTPFVVVWNAQTQHCQKKYGIDVNVTKYGILENSGESGWQGNVINLCCKGMWPSIDEYGDVINGGVPQLGNLSLHLELFSTQVKEFIPDPNYTNLAVIDFESWRPIWDTNWDALSKYKDLSEQYVKQQHPNWPRDKVIAEAKLQFEKGARTFFERTLDLARKMRPQASWGYYGFPNCFNNKGHKYCTGKIKNLNNLIQWLFNSSTALYPSGYFDSGQTDEDNKNHMYGTIREARRVRKVSGNLLKPIYVYTKYAVSQPLPHYTKLQLINSIGQTAELGVDGAVVWGDNYAQRSAQACQSTKSYVDQLLGPYVQLVLNFTRSCSKTVCMGNGRCVIKNMATVEDMGRYSKEMLRERYKSLSYNDTMNQIVDNIHFARFSSMILNSYKMCHNLHSEAMNSLYYCECYQGWNGSRCQLQL